MKKLATLSIIFILFLFPFAIAQEGTTDATSPPATTQPSPPPTEPSPITTPAPEPSPSPAPAPQEPTQGQPPSPPPEQPQPPQEDRRDEPRERENFQCPPPPTPACNSDQRAEPFYKDGCISGHNCVSGDQGQQGRQPHFQNIPPGCHLEKNEFGEFIKCEEDKRFEEEKREAAKECTKHNGRFSIRGDGSYECVAQSQGGFFNQGQCPNHEQLKQVEEKCSASNGRIEHFRDRNGCDAVSCREEFQHDFKNEDERVKFMALACEEQGGTFTINERGPNCLGGKQQIRINKDLRPLDGVELLKVALEMENVIQVFNEIAEKLTGLQQYYLEKGDEEKAKSFEIAVSQLEGAMNRLDEIRAGLAEHADSFQEQDRFDVLEDLQKINSVIKDVAVTLLTGGKAKRAATERFEKHREQPEFDEFEDEFPEEDEDIFQAFQNCQDFSKESPFKFSPEKGVSVRLEGLDSGKCVMIVNPPGFKGEVIFKLPPEIYQFFDGPHLLFRDDVECSPDAACQMMKRFIQQDQREDNRRFGERERRESREEDFDDFEDFEGPEFPEPRRAFKGGSQRDFPQQEFPQEFRDDYGDFEQRYHEEFKKGEEFRQEFEGKGYPSPEQFKDYPSPEQFKQFEQYQGQYPQQFNYPQDFNNQQFQKQPIEGNPSAGFCGDGTIAPSLGEECDDRNSKDGDGCSASCKVEQKPVAVANVIKSFGNWMRGE